MFRLDTRDDTFHCPPSFHKIFTKSTKFQCSVYATYTVQIDNKAILNLFLLWIWFHLLRRSSERMSALNLKADSNEALVILSVSSPTHTHERCVFVCQRPRLLPASLSLLFSQKLELSQEIKVGNGSSKERQRLREIFRF